MENDLADVVDASSLSEEAKKERISAAIEKATGVVREERDLPVGVSMTEDGERFKVFCKKRYVGLFDTVEEASAAYQSVKSDLDRVNYSSLSPEAKDIHFGKARDKALQD